MGYDLFNRQGEAYSANIAGWDYLTEAALAFGWKPVGISLPDPRRGRRLIP